MLKTKGQSTAEYAIVIGLVIAVAAGIMQVALKRGMATKNQQAVDWMLTSGNTVLGSADDTSMALYTQDLRKTTVSADDYKDTTVMSKGGKEEKKQVQTTETEAVSIETIDSADTGE
jgi:hypothetical protein